MILRFLSPWVTEDVFNCVKSAKKTRVFLAGIFDNGESAQGQRDLVMHCAEICYLFRTQKPVSPGNACVFILARRDGALSYFYIDAPIERKKGG